MRNARLSAGFGIAASVLTLLFTPVPAPASLIVIVCGDATEDGDVQSSDALITLRVAVGIGSCMPPRCDADSSGAITASDAMSILQHAVGQSVALRCPAESIPTTSTTSTTTTTLGATCGNGTIDPGEDCEPIETFCRGGCNPYTGICVDFMCFDDCTCPAPMCGDDMIDPGEDCDPPGSPCDGGTCGAGCGCEP